jgi:E3 ubiquitin-protein ligase HUWE1
MCGKSTFDVEDLKRHHVVSDSGAGDAALIKILPWFFNSVQSMSDEERGRLLQFTTGSSLLPHGGFKELQPAFRITLTNTTGKLPLAHTCFSEICLSTHNSFEEFNRALRTAINECTEGFALM